MNLSGPTYDKLKFLAQVLLPALGTLYFTLAGIWNLPSAEEVVGTIVAVDTFLGVVLHISTTNYRGQGGTLNVKDMGDKKMFSLELEGDPEKLENKQEVIFKVKKGKSAD